MHLIVDGASGLLMRQGKVDAVVFGADRVAANGDVANKIGTFNLAVVAKAHGVPCYAAVPLRYGWQTAAVAELTPEQHNRPRDGDRQ